MTASPRTPTPRRRAACRADRFWCWRASSAWGGIVAAVALAGRSSALPADLAANLAQLPGSEQLRRIGDAVLATDSVERDVTALCAAVAPSGIGDPVAWCTDTAPARITEHVRGASSDDFATGEVLVVEGWRLSRTEAALSALVALS